MSSMEHTFPKTGEALSQRLEAELTRLRERILARYPQLYSREEESWSAEDEFSEVGEDELIGMDAREHLTP